MTETAEDILNRHFKKFYMTYSGWSKNRPIQKTFIESAMKEIASLSWEAGVKHGFDPERHYSTEQAKEEIFKLLPDNLKQIVLFNMDEFNEKF